MRVQSCRAATTLILRLPPLQQLLQETFMISSVRCPWPQSKGQFIEHFSPPNAESVTSAVQEEEKAVAAADSKVASRFAYDVLVKEGETAGGKGGPGVKRGKDGHVQLASGDDFFTAPLSTSGRKASGRSALKVIALLSATLTDHAQACGIADSFASTDSSKAFGRWDKYSATREHGSSGCPDRTLWCSDLMLASSHMCMNWNMLMGIDTCRPGGALGGGSSAAALAKQRESEAEADLARKRFGNAKSISSAQFNSSEDSNAVDYEKQVSMERWLFWEVKLCVLAKGY